MLTYKVNKIVKDNHFNGTILISHKNKVIINEAYGYSDLVKKTMMKREHIFRIASITKQFISVSILLLCEKQFLKLDDFIDAHIPNYPNGHEIRIHHLLINSSGIPIYDLKEAECIVLNETDKLEQIIELFKYKKLEFKPGTKYKYSNSNYILLHHIIEKVSGTKLELFLKDNIFKFLEINNTDFDYNFTYDKQIVKFYDVSHERTVLAEPIDLSLIAGAGGLLSTVSDLHKWNQILKTSSVLSPSSIDLLTSCQIKIDENKSYSYGLIITSLHVKNKSLKKIYHTGFGPGVNAINSYFQDYDIEIIILSNINNPSAFAKVSDLIESISLETLL